jgi:hypothetical protein
VTIGPEERLTFGRSSSNLLPVGVGDRSVSRVAGEAFWSDGCWWLQNTSKTRPLHRLDDTGLRVPIPVAGRISLIDPLTRVSLVGSIHTHVIVFSHTGASHVPREHEHEHIDDAKTAEALLSPNEFRAVVALVEGYLEPPPRHDPRPRTYSEAAERLGIPASTVRKRIERARAKFVEAGVVELCCPDARVELAEFVLSTRMVGRDDLDLLGGRR